VPGLLVMPATAVTFHPCLAHAAVVPALRSGATTASVPAMGRFTV
jgi:hypothetical protein